MGHQWHYSQNGSQHGPVSEADLKQLAATGKLRPTDLLWKQGMAQWVPASTVAGILPQATAAVPPPPAPLPPAKQAQPKASVPPPTDMPVPAVAPPAVSAAPPASGGKPGFVTGMKQRLQSEETKALVQKAKTKWQAATTPVKAALIGGAAVGGLLLLFLFCVLPLRWFFGGSGGTISQQGKGNAATKTVSGSFQSVRGQTGKVSFGVVFSSPPKVTFTDGSGLSAKRKTIIVETTNSYFQWKNTGKKDGGGDGEVLWEATGKVGGSDDGHSLTGGENFGESPQGPGNQSNPRKGNKGSNAYQKGYNIGFEAAKALVDLSHSTNTPLDKGMLSKQADEFKQTCAAIQGVVKGGQDEKDMVRGYYDGMKAALGE